MPRFKRKQTVYVHPRLTTDPYNLRGARCRVVGTKKGVVSVVCGKRKKHGLYNEDTLLTIKEFK